MFTLYSLPNSEDCLAIQGVLYDLGVDYENKVVNQPSVFKELRELTGWDYTPALYDKVKKTVLVEKDAIIDFLKEKFEEEKYRGML